MQTDTTNDTTSTTTSNATLADYLNARADEVRHAQEDLQRQQQREAELKQERYLNDWSEVINNRVSPGLRRALELGEPQFIDKTDEEKDEDYADYYNCVEATFTLNGDIWTLRHWNGGLYLRAPNEYTVNLSHEWTSKGWSYNRTILDAITAYPAWLEQQRQRQHEAAAEAAAVEAAAKLEQRQPQRYKYTASGMTSALLHPGAYVSVWYASYYSVEIAATYGAVESFSKQWLLLNLDNGKQQLINMRHVATIEPREKPAPTPAAPETGDLATNYPDMTSDEIPF